MKKKIILTIKQVTKKEVKKENSLFDFENRTEELWKGMPEYKCEAKFKKEYASVIVHCKTEADFDEFKKLIDQPITKKTKSVYYPDTIHLENKNVGYIDEN
jgi:hypothetical protein